MKLSKNQLANFILSVCLSVLTLVSIILYAVNKSLPYFTEANVSSQIIWFLVMALLIALANIAVGFTPLKDNKIAKLVLDLLSILATFFLVGAAVYFLSDRVYYYGIALFSDLESGNPVARSSCVGALVATAFMLVSGVVSIVTNFVSKEAK